MDNVASSVSRFIGQIRYSVGIGRFSIS